MITYQSLATDFKHKKFQFRSWAYILTCEKPICSKHLEQVNNWCDTMWPNQIINYLCPPRYLNIQFVHLNLDLKKLNVFYETDSIGRFWCTAMYSLKSKHVQKMVIRTVTEEVYTVQCTLTVHCTQRIIKFTFPCQWWWHGVIKQLRTQLINNDL